MAKALYGYAGDGGSRHHIRQPQTTPAKALCGTTLSVLVTAASRAQRATSVVHTV
jgi:hypothetical protein